MIFLLNTWQFNVVLYLFCIVSFFQFYKLAVQNTKNEGAATLVLQLIAGFSILPFIPFFPFQVPTEPRVWLMLILAAVFYAIVDRLGTTTRKHLEVSVMSILAQMGNVFLIIYGFTLFKEPIIVTKVLGASLILLGNIFLQFKKGSFEINKYVVLSIVASLAYATAISIDIGTSVSFNLPFYIFFTFFIPAIILFFWERTSVSEIVNEFNTGEKKYFLLTGITWSLAVLFTLRALQLGKVSEVIPLEASAVILNVIVASIILKERSDLTKKIIAAILVIAGIVLTVQ